MANKTVNKKKSELDKIKKSLLKDYDEPVKKKVFKFKKEETKSSFDRKLIISGLVGIMIGIGIMMMIIPDRIATLANGEQVIVEIGDKNITADQLYSDMKEQYNVDMLIKIIDNVILTDLYPEDNDMKTEVNSMADYYISMYETYYGYSEEEFLKSNGFANKNEFLDELKLEYRRSLALDDYIKKNVTDKEIKKYYDESIFGETETKYISVDGTSDEAKALVDKIIARLNNGESFDDIINHYGDRITTKDLGSISYDTDIAKEYTDELIKLSTNSYSTEAIKYENNYTIVFKGASMDKPSLDDCEEFIIKTIAADKKNSDTSYYYRALIELRKNNKVDIKDTDLAERYEKYIKSVTENEQ